MVTPRIGVLALQGNVREHIAVLEELGARTALVRRPDDLSGIDGLVLPGGESSTIDKLARAFDVRAPIVERIRCGMPVFGTCAGMILLADRLIDGISGQKTFGGLDVAVRRNAFGRRMSRSKPISTCQALGSELVHATFIRAPVVEETGPDVAVLAEVDGRIVAVESGQVMATSFHPEEVGEMRFHRRFLDRVGD